MKCRSSLETSFLISNSLSRLRFRILGPRSGRRCRLCADALDRISHGEKGARRALARHAVHAQGSVLSVHGRICTLNEYPGMHIPAPLEVGAALPTDMKERSKEILTLTKMNWNSSDGISRVPITMMFARRVSELMCELSDNAAPKPSYRFYI